MRMKSTGIIWEGKGYIQMKKECGAYYWQV